MSKHSKIWEVDSKFFYLFHTANSGNIPITVLQFEELKGEKKSKIKISRIEKN